MKRGARDDAPITLTGRPAQSTPPMSARTVFGIVVRAAGLYVTYNGVIVLLSAAVASLAPAFAMSGPLAGAMGAARGAVVGVAAFAIVQVVLGLWLVRGAPQLVAFAYGGAPDETTSRAAGREARV